MCRSMADIQSAAAEIKRGKKEEEETTARKYIWSALLHRATINYNVFGRGCSMYVLLRGQVTVYHNYNSPGDDGSAGNGSSEAASSESTEFRRHLGAFVVSLNGQCVFTDQFSGPGHSVSKFSDSTAVRSH